MASIDGTPSKRVPPFPIPTERSHHRQRRLSPSRVSTSQACPLFILPPSHLQDGRVGVYRPSHRRLLKVLSVCHAVRYDSHPRNQVFAVAVVLTAFEHHQDPSAVTDTASLETSSHPLRTATTTVTTMGPVATTCRTTKSHIRQFGHFRRNNS